MSLLLTSLLLCSPAETKYPPLPEAVSSLGAAMCDGHVYVYGGHAGKTHSYSSATTSGKFRRLAVENPAAGWEELPGGTKLQGLALVSHGGKLYRVGGMEPRNAPGTPSDHHSVAECMMFDPAIKTWSALPPLPEPRSSHDAVVVGDTLVIVGGWKMQGKGTQPVWAETVLFLDLSRKDAKWESIPQPFQRRAQALAALNGLVYCVGGLTPDSDVEQAVEVLDVSKRTWTQAPPLPGPSMNGFTPGVAVSGGALFVNPADGIVYRLTRSAWEPAGEVPTKRYVHRLVTLPDGSLLALGGASKQGNVTAVERVVVKSPASPAAEKPSGR